MTGASSTSCSPPQGGACGAGFWSESASRARPLIASTPPSRFNCATCCTSCLPTIPPPGFESVAFASAFPPLPGVGRLESGARLRQRRGRHVSRPPTPRELGGCPRRPAAPGRLMLVGPGLHGGGRAVRGALERPAVAVRPRGHTRAVRHEVRLPQRRLVSGQPSLHGGGKRAAIAGGKRRLRLFTPDR